MRLVILTTETPHHLYFIREIGAHFPPVGVIVESEGIAPPFEIRHPYEAERDAFEWQTFFGGECVSLSQIYPDTMVVGNINSAESMAHLKSLRPDVTVTFGTRKLSKDLLDGTPGRMLNLHGGDPERYRGLDSHLWAIYHRDFDAIVTTLHFMTYGLDEGDIIAREPVHLETAMPLHQLRARNTDVCVLLTLRALETLAGGAELQAQKQISSGRYYSFMPACMKELCITRFLRFTTGLPL